MDLNLEAFSANQIKSKLWAAEELELVVKKNNVGPLNIYMLGGWYALLHFILKIRNNLEIDECRSLDLDPEVCVVANNLNIAWEQPNWSFKSFPQDVNTVTYPESVNCVINTSSEHIDSNEWFDKISAGTLCLIQSNDLKIDEHTNTVQDLRELKQKYPLSEFYFEGTRPFKSYKRFMIIGLK